MMRLTRTAIGLLTAQYRSVLRKCFLINVGLYALLAPAASLTTATAVAVTAMPNVAQADELSRQEINAGQTVDKIEGTYINHTDTNVVVRVVYDRGTVNSIIMQAINNVTSMDSTLNSSVPALIYTSSTGEIKSITGTYSGNTYNSTKTSSNTYGNIILNEGSIGTIDATFSSNTTNQNSGTSYADGVIVNHNGNRIDNILGSFVSNAIVSASTEDAAGAAIKNSAGTIDNIDALFMGNATQNTSSGIAEGAIANLSSGTINSLNGTFIGNYAQANSGVAQGGAVYNITSGNIGSIGAANDKALFIGNYAQSESGNAQGGAIYNAGTITGDINADFINNYVSGGGIYNYGGAILNYNPSGAASIGNIKGNFIGNNINGSNSGYGGAIFNWSYRTGNSATIGNIEGNFINNYIKSDTTGVLQGGAIFQDANGSISSSISSIKGNFIGNGLIGEGSASTAGGAITQTRFSGASSSITEISGKFINNTANSANSSNTAFGGAIYNTASITRIVADFIGNKALTNANFSAGGAIYNQGTINSVIGNFINNKVSSVAEQDLARGGAIYNYGNMTIKDSTFYGNEAWRGGAIYADTYSKTNIIAENKDVIFKDNKTTDVSGVLITYGDVGFVGKNGHRVIFDGNGSRSYGAIYIDANDAVNIENALFKNNTAGHWGIIQNQGELALTNTDFISNVNDSQGGAINSSGKVSIIADGKDVTYYGNKVKDEGLYHDIDAPTLNLNASEGNTIRMSGTVEGSSTININGSNNKYKKVNDDYSTSEVSITQTGGDYVFNNTLTGGTVNLYNNANVRFGNVRQQNGTKTYGNLNVAATTVGEAGKTENNGAYMNFAQGSVNWLRDTSTVENFGNLTLNGDLKLGIDFDLSMNSSDIFSGTLAETDNKILIDYINAYGIDNEAVGTEHTSVYSFAKENMGLTDTIHINSAYEWDGYSAAYTPSTGRLTLEKVDTGTENLAGFLSQNATGTEYNMVRDEQMLVDLDAMAGENNAKTVNANGHNIIGNQHSGVTLADGQTLTINDANVEGFYKEDDSGGVISSSTGSEIININNSTFRNNSTVWLGNTEDPSKRNFGAAVAGSGNIVDSDFYNNIIIGNESYHTQGGALYGQFNIYARNKDSIFEGNYSGGSAGVYNTNGSNIKGENGHKVIFSNNTAGISGGAVTAYYNDTTIDNAEFLYNTAPEAGAVDNIGYGKTDISNTLFKGNNANSGGAILNRNGGVLNITDSTFENNTATSQGGAIYNAGTIGEFDADEKPVEGKGIINTTFKGNMANSGAAITNASGAIITNIENVIFENNLGNSSSNVSGSAITNGGIIYKIVADFIGNGNISEGEAYGAIQSASGVINSIENSLFEGNYAIGYNANGAAIFNGYIDYIKDTVFKDNYAIANTTYAQGGAIYLYSDNYIKNLDADFINNYTIGNTASGYRINAGAIDIHNSAYIGTITGNFIGNHAINQSGDATGGAIDHSGSTITAIGTSTGSVTFRDNYALSTGTGDAIGGAINVNSGSTITSIGTADNHAKFEGNYAQANTGNAYGGAIYNSGTIDNIYADFKDNKATSASNLGHGGAIYNTGNMKITDSNFIGNEVSGSNNGYGDHSGGAIYNTGAMLIVADNSDVNFKNNKASTYATGNGGAIDNSNGTMVIKGSNGHNIIFEGNIAGDDGAAIQMGAGTTEGKLTVINAIFKNNISSDKANQGAGAGITYGQEGNISTIIDSDFLGNSAGDGGHDNLLGGAAIGAGTLNLVADNKDVNFRNNITKTLSYGNVYNDIANQGELNLNAAVGKSIDFGGSINAYTPMRNIININKSGLTYTDLNDDFTTVEKNITQAGGDYIFRNEVSGQTMNLYDGANVQLRNLRQADGTTSYGRLWLSGFNSTGEGNILDVRNGVAQYNYTAEEIPEGATELGNFSLDKDVLYRIDVDLNNNEPGRSEALADYINGTYSSGSGKLVIDAINILQEGSKNDPWVAAPSISSYVKLADTVHTYTTDYKDSYNVTYYKDSSNIGRLNFTDNGTTNLNLVGFLSNAGAASLTEYNMTSDEPVLRNIDAMTGTTKTVNAQDAQGNNYTISGNGYAGVIVDKGQTLNINGGIWDGFSANDVFILLAGDSATNAPKLNVTDAIFTNNDNVFGGRAGSILDNNSYATSTFTDTSFIGNSNKAHGHGGIIWNNSKLNIIAENKDIQIKNNTAKTKGGAIYSVSPGTTTINATGGDVIFSNNTAGTQGGAIYNESTLSISASNGHKVIFDNNALSQSSSGTNTQGGAIYNTGTLTLNGETPNSIVFKNQDLGAEKNRGWGAAIYTTGQTTINNAEFYNNSANWSALDVQRGGGNATITNSNFHDNISGVGGAIHVESGDGLGTHGRVSILNTTFKNNETTNDGGAVQVGGIATITDSDFINNKANPNGGAIQAWQATDTDGVVSTLSIIAKDKDVNFTGNKAVKAGGAILVTGTPELAENSYLSIKSEGTKKVKFENNGLENTEDNAYGGAIANAPRSFSGVGANIAEITADFTGNYAKSTGEYAAGAGGMVISKDTDDNQGSGRAYGGAIFNLAQVTKDDAGNITGVVENTGVIDSISGNFKDNYVYSENGSAAGAAIYNEYGTIGQIGSADNKALFEGNKIHNIGTGFGMTGATGGGTIYNVKGTIGDIYADFTNNFGKASDITAGTALSNFDGSVGNIVGNFTDNEMENSENGHGTLNNRAFSSVASITSIVGNFINNSIKTNKDGYGGAIMNYKITGDAANIAHIGTIEGIFENNGITAERYVKGGAIANLDNNASEITAIIDSITGTFRNNYVIATGTNLVEAHGAAIYNTDQISNIQDSTFEGNYIIAPYGKAMGGAIWNSGNINLSALQSDVNFWNNKANDRYNDIYNSGTMNFNAAQNKTMSFGGSIEGAGAININTGTTSGGTYVFKSDVSAGNVVVGSAASNYAPASLSFEKATQEDGSITNGTFDVDSLTINGDGNSLSTRNDKVDTNSATTLTLNNALNLQIDGDLQSGKGDSLAVSNLTAAPKSLRLTAMNFTADPDVTTLSKTDTIDVDISDGEIASLDGAYTLASTNPDDTTEAQIEQTYLNNLTSSSGNYNKTYAFRSAKLMTSGNNQTYVQYGDAITLKWLYENYINGWSGGNYILNNVTDGGDPDSTHLTVGQALTALDSALGQNDTYDFSTQSVADVLVNNYYTKLMKKDEKFDTNEGIMDVKSWKKDTNSSQGRIIKGVSAFPSNLCAYPFDMPHTANDNHKSVIVKSAKHDVTIFGRQSDNTATTSKQAA